MKKILKIIGVCFLLANIACAEWATATISPDGKTVVVQWQDVYADSVTVSVLRETGRGHLLAPYVVSTDLPNGQVVINIDNGRADKENVRVQAYATDGNNVWWILRSFHVID